MSLKSGGESCKRRGEGVTNIWYGSFMKHTQNNLDTNTEMTMKTDIYYKELIMASSIIQRIDKRKYIAYIILTRKSSFNLRVPYP